MRLSQTPIEAARSFAKAIKAQDSETAIILAGEFLRVVRLITAEIAAYVAAAQTYTKREQRERLEVIRAQMVSSLEAFGQFAGSLITVQQRAAIASAVEDAHTLFLLSQARSTSQLVASASWTRAPIEALEMLVGKLANGSTMGDYLAAKAGEAWPKARTEIIRSLATGRNPRRTARAIRAAMNGNLVSALITSREAQVGTYNEATLEQYRANPELIKGYRRLSALGPRTCALCWALHGKFYRLAEEFVRHLNCRCTLVPEVEGLDSNIGDGEDLFRESTENLKRKVLRVREYELYQAGKIELSDLIGYRDSAKWGRTLRRKTLSEIDPDSKA